MAERLEKGEWRRITKCAEGIYLRGVIAGWTPDQIQAEILRVAPMMKRLEARRHAMDWPRQRVVNGIALLMETNGQHCPLRETDVFDWERKGRIPYDYIAYLSQLFHCNAADLGYPGFSANYRPGPGTVHPSDQEATTNRAQFFSWSGAIVAGGAAELLVSEPDEMHQALDTGSVGDRRLDELDASADQYGLKVGRVPPATVLDNAVLDFTSVRRLVKERQLTRHQIRLCRIGAKLAIVIGEALFNAGTFSAASRWYKVAQHAARDAGDQLLFDIALASSAYLPGYSGDPHGVLALVTSRLEQVAIKPSPGVAFLHAFAGKAYASLGERDAFKQSMDASRAAVAASRPETIHSGAHSFMPEKVSFYEATSYARLGDAHGAIDAADEALSRYDLSKVIDRALIHIDRATGLVHSGEIPEACRYVTLGLTEPNYVVKTASVISRAQEFDRMLGDERHPAVRDWREFLASVRPNTTRHALPAPCSSPGPSCKP